MPFRRNRNDRGRSRGFWLTDLLLWCAWAFSGLTTVAVLAAGALYLRLSHGPIHLPYLANLAVVTFNSDSERFKAELGDLILTLGDADLPSGLQFVDLTIRDEAGEPLFAVPNLAARFDTASLLRGEIRPTQILLIRPKTRVTRLEGDRFRFGLGDAPVAAAGIGEVAPSPQINALARILDGLAGDAPLTPELSMLREVRIARADFSYEHMVIGRTWRTRRANLVIRRREAGVQARVTLRLADDSGAGAGMVITAERSQGTGQTKIVAEFARLQPEHLAEQVDQLQWLKLFSAPVDGRLAATLSESGKLEALGGRIAAGPGQILALESEGQPFDTMSLDFAYEPGLERMRISALKLTAPAADAEMSGFVDLQRDEVGLVSGLAGQLAVTRLAADVPQVFAERLEFDDGQVVARVDLSPGRIEVASAYLRREELVLNVSGAAWTEAGEWHTDLRAEGRNLTVAQLVQHWPIIAAPNPRAWIETNIHQGKVDHVVAQMRLGAGPDQLSLDFRYSELVSSYLKQMTPIQKASGQGSLTLEKFHLWMEAGEVEPVQGVPVDLTGSDFVIQDIRNRPWPSKATVRARGPTLAILTLINEEPLGFVDKLGLDPLAVEGTAEVTAELHLPLIRSLRMADVEVEARSALNDLRLPFTIPGRTLDVAGTGVSLTADKEQLRVAGPVRLNGKPMVMEWREHFRPAAESRRITIEGQATNELLADFGLENEYFRGGSAPMKLQLTQTGAELGFDLDADLDGAVMGAEEFNWRKPQQAPGRLTAQGTIGNGIRVSNFAIMTDELVASGAAIFAGGKLQNAEIERAQFRGKADISLSASRNEEDGFVLTVGGSSLDLSIFETPEGTESVAGHGQGPAAPLDVNFDIGELFVTRQLVAQPATGTYRRNAARLATARMEGRLAGQVPFSAEYVKAAAEPAQIEIRSEDAGALARAAGIFSGAAGGSLQLRARIAPKPGVELIGDARIKDVRISGSQTFESILEEGEVSGAAEQAKTGGLAFDKVKVPFELRTDKLVLGETTAEGSVVTVKIEGTVDETTETIDLVGVISPFESLSSPINKIPILGTILAGGDDEGIFAMTFSVGGTVDEPDISVQPLSILTPGILRKVFSGRVEKPDERFLRQLDRDND